MYVRLTSAYLGSSYTEQLRLQVFAKDGDTVAEGDAILELSSMKLFYAVNAPCSGVLSGLRVAPGDKVGSGQVLFDVVAKTESAAPTPAD